jgi:hypothetical protein
MASLSEHEPHGTHQTKKATASGWVGSAWNTTTSLSMPRRGCMLKRLLGSGAAKAPA